jgi:cell division protein FtsQ
MLIGVAAIDAVLGLLLLYIVFLHLPYFNLGHVEVTGTRRLSREEVIEASELESGINLLTINLSGITDKLRRHPWIRSASVYRQFPGRMIIEVEERTPRAILAAGKLYYVDEHAEYFTRLLPGDPVNHPLFTGIGAEDLQTSGTEVRELLRLGLSLLDLLEHKSESLGQHSVAEIRMSLDEGLTLVMMSNQEVVLGKGSFDLKIDRYERLKRFLTRQGEWNNARIIDLDFDDRALVRSGKSRIQG